MIREIIIPNMDEEEMQRVRDYYKNTPNGYKSFKIKSVEIRPPNEDNIMAGILHRDYIYKNVVFELSYAGLASSCEEGANVKRTQKGLIDLLSEMLKDSI